MERSDESIKNQLKEGKSLDMLIDYQDHSVVSKTIVQNKSGTLTIFAFDKGEELSEHTSPFDAFVYIIDGKAQITISGKSYHISKGQFLLMPANEPHALKAEDRFKMLLIMIKEA